MPSKKKKKSRVSIDADPGSCSKATPSDPMISDCLALQIVASSTPPVKTIKYTPMIVMTADDADNLGVIAGDHVIIMSERESALVAGSVARVHVAYVPTTPASSKSPSSLSKAQTRSKLSPGYCHVFPVSLVEQLRNPCQESSNSEAQIPSTPATPLNATTESITPSPSKSKFSFAKGGGGDRLISTPSTPETPKSRPQDMARTRNKLWAVPIESDLGDQMSDLLLSAASEITITSESSNSLSSNLGRQLIRAQLASSYVTEGMTIHISFQGVSTPCQIVDFQKRNASSEIAVEDKLATMTLNEKLDLEAQKLLSMARQENSKLKLSQITNETRIKVKDDESNLLSEDAQKEPPKPLLAGLDRTIQEVMDLLLTPLKHPELFQGEDSLKPPKGLLLFGPSGVGKTKLAMYVSQLLEFHHKVSVKKISCTRLQSQTALVGQAEQELVTSFEQAAKNSEIEGSAATLILLDDVHLICPRRQGMNIGADRLAATLLALLDGVDSPKTGHRYCPTMILAVSSNPSLLDPALRRPGRLDAEVSVPLPDEPGTRSLILRFHLEYLETKALVDSEDEWLTLARLAKGFTGADLLLAAKEAVRMSIFRFGNQFASQSVEVRKEDLEAAIRSIKPSAIKSVSVEIPKVLWSSIGGMELVKRELQEAIEFPLTHAAVFQKLGIRPPRGVLLYGPPGCSKTLMARALATEGQMNFLAVKGPELLSKWLGESERALASLFRRARLASPSVIFFDEVDAIATKRGGGNSGGGERLLSQLLTELDGISTAGGGDSNKQRVVVVCATNRPDLLDGALMRPGRIDRMIYVGVPDEDSRKGILKVGLKGRALDGDIDISALATEEVSGGLSGAELVGACRNAALLALEEDEDKYGTWDGKPSIGMRHLTKALKNTERQITPEMIEFYMKFQNGGNAAGSHARS